MLEAGVLFVNNIKFALTTHNLAVGTSFFNGCSNFHNLLFIAENDASSCQIVRGHFQLYPIAVRETDEPLPHLSRNMSENLMLIRQLNPEHRSSEDGGDFTLGFDCLFCRHDLKRYF